MFKHPTGNQPKTVHIVACGFTQRDYLAAIGVYNSKVPIDSAEVWTLNKALRGIKADFGFVLDDLIKEHRVDADYIRQIAGIAKQVPILTTELDAPTVAMLDKQCGVNIDEVHQRFYEYPIKEIRDKLGKVFGEQYYKGVGEGATLEYDHARQFGNDLLYLKNSFPMMLCYAWFIGVKTVFVWGADYTHPAGQRREDDQPNAEFWVGFLKGQGIQVVLTSDTTLCSTREGKALYGYARQPKL